MGFMWGECNTFDPDFLGWCWYYAGFCVTCSDNAFHFFFRLTRMVLKNQSVLLGG